MKVKTVVVGTYQTNCYILLKGNCVLVVDPGDEFEKIKPLLSNRKILGALVTHHHEDHIGALEYFDKIYDFNNLRIGKNEIGPFKFEVIYTPGHTSDSVTYYFYQEKVMFTGDFLFKETIGRTDLKTGNQKEMLLSLNKIKKYPDVKIYPGHGLSTTLDYEKQNNVYLRQGG